LKNDEKTEARVQHPKGINTKSETIPNDQNANDQNNRHNGIVILFLSLEHLLFEFVLSFEIRISDFASVRPANHAPWA